jgi:hypothetical protein
MSSRGSPAAGGAGVGVLPRERGVSRASVGIALPDAMPGLGAGTVDPIPTLAARRAAPAGGHP